jgi:DNA-directed RNA polymerase subunit RPC12/RpoP
MIESCSKCGKRLEPVWKLCPDCATPHKHEAHKLELPEHEKAPVKGGFGGLLLGLAAAPVLIIGGTLICLTGLGVFLGVPMIIAGVIAPLAGPFLGLNALKGGCPWCGAEVSSVAMLDSFSCPACGKRIVVKKQEMSRAG